MNANAGLLVFVQTMYTVVLEANYKDTVGVQWLNQTLKLGFRGGRLKVSKGSTNFHSVVIINYVLNYILITNNIIPFCFTTYLKTIIVFHELSET